MNPSVRLEQGDSYLKRFHSVVTAVRQEQDACWLALAESAFYPSSGGQPHDTGLLAGLAVSEVVSQEGRVWHRIAGELAVGERVLGELDWQRRYCHMQRHSAQHLLSQACLQVNPAFETQAVSLMSAECSLDLAGLPSNQDLAACERLVNDVAYQALDIRSFVVTEAELANYPLRRPAKVTGKVRLVQIGDFDLSACGGTHLRTTAEALPIKVLGLERIRKQLTRVYFCAGLEALADYQHKHRLSTELVRLSSTQLADLPERFSALQADLKESQRKLKTWQLQVAELQAARSICHAQPSPQGQVVLQFTDPELLMPLAMALSAYKDVVALLAAVKAETVQLVFARGSAVTADMNAVLQLALPHIAGRGGGKAQLARGAGAGGAAGAQAALQAASESLQQAL